MATVITRAFEQWQTQQIFNNLPARPDTVIFAYVPGQDPSAEIDRDEGIPINHIVYQDNVAQYGVINASAVAYSIVLDTRVGDFTFNWIGLVDKASNTLCMIVHTLPQQKIATANGVQGNNITRTFVMEFAGAAESSHITVSAQTWQIDFSARLAGIDEANRLTNLDYYGPHAFIGDGFHVTREQDKYRVRAGLAYIGGVRAELLDDHWLEHDANGLVYAVVSWQGSVLHRYEAIVYIAIKPLGENLHTSVDELGFIYYEAPLATIIDGKIEDKRGRVPQVQITDDINRALLAHAASRDHPDATLTEKGMTRLNNAVTSDDERTAATPKAVKQAYDNANARLEKSQNGADIPDKAAFVNNLGLDNVARTYKTTIDLTGLSTDYFYPVWWLMPLNGETRISIFRHFAENYSQFPFGPDVTHLAGLEMQLEGAAHPWDGNANYLTLKRLAQTYRPTVRQLQFGMMAIARPVDNKKPLYNGWTDGQLVPCAARSGCYLRGGLTYHVEKTFPENFWYSRDENEVTIYAEDHHPNFEIRWTVKPFHINDPALGPELNNKYPQYDSADLPVGTPLFWPTAIPPQGWLKCNGATFDTELYPKLAQAYPNGVLPDLRGEFIRGWDDGRGVDPGRGLLGWQSDALQNIVGEIRGGCVEEGGVATGAFQISGMFKGAVGKASDNGFNFDASRVARTAAETRPRNIAFNYIVRAA